MRDAANPREYGKNDDDDDDDDDDDGSEDHEAETMCVPWTVFLVGLIPIIVVDKICLFGG
jgi:hypothetical protein